MSGSDPAASGSGGNVGESPGDPAAGGAPGEPGPDNGDASFKNPPIDEATREKFASEGIFQGPDGNFYKDGDMIMSPDGSRPATKDEVEAKYFPDDKGTAPPDAPGPESIPDAPPAEPTPDAAPPAADY